MTARLRLPGADVLANVASRVVALVALALATVVVARTGGPADVGVYALLRVLPGLAGVLAACGLPSAAAYFVAGPTRDHPRLWPTVAALMLAGAALGALGWVVATPLLQQLFFSRLSVGVVALAGATVATQLPLSVAKGCLQGLEDPRGTNVVIANEELAFLPAYLLARLLGLEGATAILLALGLADVVVAGQAWRRVQTNSAVRPRLLRPDRELAIEVCRYGFRAQIGGMLTLLNLRLDFAVLGALASPSVLGTYAVASKYAELLRLPGLAITWVLYPRMARRGPAEVAQRGRRLMPLVVALTIAVAAPLALLAPRLLPALYGREFAAAVAPTYVLLAGLWLGGASGIATAYLFGSGSPGRNSACLGAGVLLTVALDLALIPRHGAMGAAVASAVAYASTDLLLLLIFLRGTRTVGRATTTVGG